MKVIEVRDAVRVMQKFCEENARNAEDYEHINDVIVRLDEWADELEKEWMQLWDDNNIRHSRGATD